MIVNIMFKAMDRQILDQIRANDIPDKEIEENREKRPTREDVRRLLSEKEGKIFFLQITFNAKRGKTLDYKDIYEHLYERYRLYKLRSSIKDGKTESHTLSPSTYIAYINQNQGRAIQVLVGEFYLLLTSIIEHLHDNNPLFPWGYFSKKPSSQNNPVTPAASFIFKRIHKSH